MSNSTQNDWEKRFDELFDYRHYDDQNEKWASILDRKDYNPASPEQIKDFIAKELADARREAEVKCDECRKNPCYKCLGLKYGKWRSPVNKNDPAWIHTREATLRKEKENE